MYLKEEKREENGELHNTKKKKKKRERSCFLFRGKMRGHFRYESQAGN